MTAIKIKLCITCNAKYKDFYFVAQFHGFALHSDRCATCHKAYTNFVDESACLTANNVRNELAAIHKSQEVLKMLSLYM
jgi:hypothetical protein